MPYTRGLLLRLQLLRMTMVMMAAPPAGKPAKFSCGCTNVRLLREA